SEAVSRLKPNPQRGHQGSAEWPVIAPAYEAWKAGRETPASGTALDAWPGCPAELATALRAVMIRSVEDFAAMPDHLADKVKFPGTKDVRDRAKAFCKASDGSAVADQLHLRDRTIEALQKQMAAMEEKMAGMSAAPVADAPAVE